MKKTYWIKSNAPFSRSSFRAKIDMLKTPYQLEVKGEREMTLFCEKDISHPLEGILITIGENEGVRVTALRTHNEGELAAKCVDEALSFYPNSVRYISDIILKELSFGNYSSFPLLSAEFRSIDETILLTVGAYLRNNCSISSASESLYIHRNTFRYRLNRFYEETNLDLHDYHDVLLLELYFQLGRKRG